MANLSKAQMRMYAAAVGFPNPEMMAEVGFAESGGNAKVVNSIGCVGILQINQPVHIKSHPTWTVAWLQNPLNNFRAGKVLYDADVKAGGNGLRPWEDSRLKGNGGGWGKTDAFKRFSQGKGSTASNADFGIDNLPGLGGDLDPLNPDGPLSGLADVAGSVTDIAKLGVQAGVWLSNPRNWLNLVYIVTGGAIVVVSLSATLRTQILGQARGLIKEVGNQ